MLERLRYGSRKPSQLSPSEELKQGILSHSSIPASSQNAFYHSSDGNRIRALDINSCKTHVVIAGNKILRTLRIANDNTCVEEYDIRDAASNTQDITAAQRDTFEIEDVAWSRDGYRDYIATAARNGKILLYNIARPEVQIGRLHDHLQQVHKVDFSPLEGGCLLSASQDGTVRLWDLRKSQGNSMVCSSHDTFHGRSDSVRHAKWSPRSTWNFAFCTDSGGIQMWDIRNNSTPLLKFAAHYQTCNSIDWHPDGKHLVSAGRDQDVNVWNMEADGSRKRPIFTLKTPYSVQNVRWRPVCHVQDYNDQVYKQCTHLATAYKNYPVIHVWDMRRPLLPFKEVHHQKNRGTTDMLWRTKDLIWSVGLEGEFSQIDVPYAPKTLDRRPLSTTTIGPDGGASLFIKKRPARKESDESDMPRIHSPDVEAKVQEKLPYSRSPGDDSFEEHFLTPSPFAGTHHSRTPSVRSTKSFGTPPPSFDELSRTPMIDFDVVLGLYESFDTGQTAKYGLMPGLTPPLETAYLAQKYKLPMIDTELDIDYILNLRSMFEQNAEYAQRASRYRDAQTWRIFILQLEQELRQRAIHNRQKRQETIRKGLQHRVYSSGRSRATSLVVPHTKSSLVTSPNLLAMQDKDSASFSEMVPNSRSVSPTLSRKPVRRRMSRLNSSSTINSKQLLDTSSNTTTPLVKPVRPLPHDVIETEVDSDNSLYMSARTKPTNFLWLTEPTANDHVGNGADAHSKSTIHKPSTSPGSEHEELWKPSRHMPFSLDEPGLEQDDPNALRQRRNSAESLKMFSSSTDSQSKLSHSTSFASMSKSGGNEQGEFDTTNRDNHNEATETGFFSPTRRNLHARLTIQNHPAPFSSDELRARSSGAIATGYDTIAAGDPNLRGSKESPAIARSFSAFASVNIQRADAHSYQNQQEEEPAIVPVPVPSPAPRITHLNEEAARGNDTKSSTLRNDDFTTSDFVEISDQEHATKNAIANASEMLHRLVNWYIDRGDAQMAASLLLIAAPLLAPHGMPSMARHCREDEAVDAAYLEVFNSEFLAFAPDDASDILRDHHQPFDLLNISPICAESILSSYHEQLLALNLLNPATYLRRLAYPAFPSVYEQGLKDVEIGLLCKACKSPIFNRVDKLCCETCDTYQASCSICWSRISPYELSVAKKKKKDQTIGSTPSDHTPDQIPSTSIYDDATNNASGRTSGDVSTFLSMTQDLDGDEDTQQGGFSQGLTSSPHSRRTLYSTCSLCNHSVHAACSTHWYLDPSSGGACPQPGCLCACVRGKYREEKLEEMQREERRVLAERAEKEEQRKENMLATREAAERTKAAKTYHSPGASEITRLRGALKTSTSATGQDSSVEGDGRTTFEAKRVRVMEPSGSAEL